MMFSIDPKRLIPSDVNLMAKVVYPDCKLKVWLFPTHLELEIEPGHSRVLLAYEYPPPQALQLAQILGKMSGNLEKAYHLAVRLGILPQFASSNKRYVPIGDYGQWSQT